MAKAEHLVGHEDALREFMQLTAALLAGNRVLFDALDRVGADHRPQVRAQVDRLAAVAERVVAPARDAGVIRADVRGLDVVQLTCGAHHAAAPLAAVEPDVGQRYVDFVFAACVPPDGRVTTLDRSVLSMSDRLVCRPLQNRRPVL
ncbi:hypothetical protein AB0383_21040 [Amycolatopsis sp. NPDC051373]|uniref:SbtR family transcriptional regulator n=1 Tax=Amycolatopsis sp. NPDC051373 TaxID=3155801 RepID=UPI00344C8186